MTTLEVFQDGTPKRSSFGTSATPHLRRITYRNKLLIFDLYHTYSIALNYKRLPFKTTFIEYPDIGPKAKELGLDVNKPGAAAWPYTVPIIIDTTKSKENPVILMESFAIVDYLDEAYPERKIHRGSEESRAAQKEFLGIVGHDFFPAVPQLFLTHIVAAIPPRMSEWVRRTRETIVYHDTLENLIAGPKKEQLWSNLFDGLDKMEAYLDQAEAEGKEVLYAKSEEGKDEPTWVAMIIVAAIVGGQRLHVNPWWDRIKTRNNGRWLKLYGDAAHYLSA